MKLPLTRVRQVPMPKMETRGSCGFDLSAAVDVTVKPDEISLIPTGIVAHVPDGFALLVIPRSSLPRGHKLIFPHSVGLIDRDYNGPDDEVFIQVQNVGKNDTTIMRGDRIAQGIIVPCPSIKLVEKQVTNAPSRGGFGSTGI